MPVALTVFYDNSCVLHHFRVRVISVIIPDDSIIATESHYYMPDLSRNAMVTYDFILACTIAHMFHLLGVIFTDNHHTTTFSPKAHSFLPDSIFKTNFKREDDNITVTSWFISDRTLADYVKPSVFFVKCVQV